MIRKLENIDKIENKQEIVNFIKKVSPFTEQNARLKYLVEEFIDNDMNKPVLVSMNEMRIDPFTRTNSIKHFMVWTIRTTLFVGTEFISESELTSGLNLSKYEKSAS